MARSFPTEFIIIIVCIVLIFICGLLLPRFLSEKYFQLRNELDSESDNLKYSQQENLKHIQISLNSQNHGKYTSGTIRSVIKSENVQEDSSDSISIPLNAPAKVKKRSKRRASFDKDRIMSWNFSLNLLRQDSNSLEEVKNVSDASDHNSMGVTVGAKGKGKQNIALAELQNALSSVKQFINNFFKSQQNVTRENVEFSPDEVTFDIKSEVQTPSPDIVKFESDGSGGKPINAKRQGKFIFGMFGFGKKSIESTTNFEGESLIATENGTDMRILRVPGILLESVHSLKNETDVEKDPEIINLITESLVMQTNNIDSDEMINNAEFGLTDMIDHESSNNTIDSVDSLSEKGETDFQEEISETKIIPTKPSFTGSVLELFCMSLVNKVGESQHLFDSDEGNTSDFQNIAQNQLRSSQNSSFLSLLNVFNSIQEKEFATDPNINEDFVSISNDELVTEIELLKQRESRFFNFAFGFGSGRSAISEESSNLENAENEDIIKLENLPSLLDCESYFRKKENIKMFPKPNLMDMISDPKIQLVDFANATISSKLQEQNLQFLTDLLKTSLNNTVDTFTKNSGDAGVAKFNGKKDLTEHKDIVNDVDATDGELNITESSDSQLSKPMSTSAGIEEVLDTTESQRTGKFINFFGFGSGLFGSGMRSLETSDNTESDSMEELGSGDVFKKIDMQLRNFGKNVSQERFFGFLGFGGSGDGRELAEDEKTTETNKITLPCDQDCIQVATEKSNDCDDDISNLENPQHNEHFDDTILRNESRCDEDCFTNHTADDGKTDIDVRNISVEQILNENKNLRQDLNHNCSCYNETTDGNITFSECDECSFEDIKRMGESHESLGQQSVVLRNDSTVKFKENYETDCYDCSTGGTLLEKGINFTSKNMSFPECHGCSFNSTNMPKLEFSEKDSVKNADRHNITFQECDDCSFSALDEGEMHETTENLSYQDILLKDTNRTILHDYGTNCHDCNDAYKKQSNETILYLDNLNESGVHTLLINADSNDHVKLNDSINVNNAINENVESLTDVNEVQNVVNEQTTEMHLGRFMGTIFLTGSGDGGLFADSVGPINLIEESTIASPVFSLRPGSSDDTFTNPTEMWKESDLKELSNKDLPEDTTKVAQTRTSISPNFRSFRRGRLNDGFPDSFDILNKTNQGDLKSLKNKTTITEEEIATVSEDFSHRRGKLDDAKFDYCDDCDADLAEIMDGKNLNSSSTNENAPTTSKTSNNFEVRESIYSTIPHERKSDITNTERTKEQLPLDIFTSGIPVPTNPPRFCSSASECNRTLNERCRLVNSSPICTCGRAYVRHKETRKCVVKRIVNTSIKLPGEKFDEKLKDHSSQRYKEMKKYATYWMSSLLRNTMPNLWPNVSNIDVVKFSPGSLIVNWNIVFAVENESEEKIIRDVSGSLQKALQNESLSQKVPLNTSDASLNSVNSVDPCDASKLNDCYCQWKAVPEGFTCQCSEQFRDFSTYSHHVEETCLESCSDDYCSFNGHCEIINNKRICLCNGLYFGRHCDVPGLFIVIILGIIAVVSVALLLIVIFSRRCRRGNNGRSQTFRRSQEVGSHVGVSDTIAMEENVGATVSKFMSITTPTQPPLIKIIKPTVSESITSFEYDCQFDDSPSSEVLSGAGNTTV